MIFFFYTVSSFFKKEDIVKSKVDISSIENMTDRHISEITVVFFTRLCAQYNGKQITICKISKLISLSCGIFESIASNNQNHTRQL